MAKINFTIDAIKSLPVPAAGRKEYHDSECPGLTVIVTKAGSRIFYRYGRIDGKPERVRIGQFPEWSVAAARRQCRIITGEISQGSNPQQKKRAARLEKTVQDLWDWYFANCCRDKKKRWKRELAIWERLTSRWARRKVSLIERADFVELHNEALKGGEFAGDLLLASVRHMWSEAIANKWAQYDPTQGIPYSTKVRRRRFLREDEMPAFFRELALLSRRPRDYFLLRILTGARSSNVQSMRFSHVNWISATWEIPKEESKNKEAMTITLDPWAMQILQARRKDYGDQDWVFPSHSKLGHYTCPKTAWKKLITNAGLENIRPHDLRRTLGTWQNKQGSPVPTIAESLGHKSHEATMVYTVAEQDDVRSSVARATKAIRQAAIENSGNSSKLHVLGVWCACGARVE